MTSIFENGRRSHFFENGRRPYPKKSKCNFNQQHSTTHATRQTQYSKIYWHDKNKYEIVHKFSSSFISCIDSSIDKEF
jgi:hypothetical protein